MEFNSFRLKDPLATDSLNNCLVQPIPMVGLRLSRRARKFLKKIQRAPGKYELQEAASTIQAELDKRLISYDEALTLGNIIQHRADQFVDDDTIFNHLKQLSHGKLKPHADFKLIDDKDIQKPKTYRKLKRKGKNFKHKKSFKKR